MQLISTKLLKHSDKEVRLVTCCCIVEILRVFAPDAPFNDDDMVLVFEVLISQVAGMSNCDSSSSAMSKILYILSSLATVKSCGKQLNYISATIL